MKGISTFLVGLFIIEMSSMGQAESKLPWNKTLRAEASSTSEQLARFQVDNDLRRQMNGERHRCALDRGYFNVVESVMMCRKSVGSFYRCQSSATCYCRARLHSSAPKAEPSDALESNLVWGTSPVFSDRQDCRAIAMNNLALCRGVDCRAVLRGTLSGCRSNDCRAMVRDTAGLCQTRDCRAVVYNNAGMCESANCRSVLRANAGLCR